MLWLAYLALTTAIANAQNIVAFRRLDSLLQYASQRSITLRADEERRQYARQAVRAARLQVLDPRINTYASYTNNTQLPVTPFPAEITGGQPGTFVPIQTGVQYNTVWNAYGELKLINPGAYAQLRQSNLNLQQSETQQAVSRRDWQQNVANQYYTLLNLQSQIAAAEDNLVAADSLLQLTQRKLAAGLVRQQDANDARVNYLNSKDNLQQLRYQWQERARELKLLADLSAEDSLVLTETVAETPDWRLEPATANNLSLRNAQLEMEVAQAAARKADLDFLPTLSFFASTTQQQFNTTNTVTGGNWIPSTYIGLKLSLTLPDASSLSTRYQARNTLQLAKLDLERARLESDLESLELDVASRKAYAQYLNLRDIYHLRRDSYQRNLDLYTQGLQALTPVLDSYNAMVSARSSLITSVLNVHLAQANIQLYNQPS